MSIKEQLKDLEDKIARGLEESYKKMIEFKKSKKTPVIVSKKGKVIKVDPDSMQPTTTYKR